MHSVSHVDKSFTLHLLTKFAAVVQKTSLAKTS